MTATRLIAGALLLSGCSIQPTPADPPARVGQDPKAVCGTIDGNDPSARPADSHVAAPSWVIGCASD